MEPYAVLSDQQLKSRARTEEIGKPQSAIVDRRERAVRPRGMLCIGACVDTLKLIPTDAGGEPVSW